jgi:phosphoribosylanthranilate isomerase
MRVKICGITNLEDALVSVANGADALGFVFYEKSPRYISPKDAKAIIDKLPPFVERVGLFVECGADKVNRISKEAGISLAQIHFEAKKKFYDDLKIKHIKVIRAKSKDDLSNFDEEFRLVDAYVPGYGGEGKRLDLEWFKDVDCSKIILAGGINSKNLEEVRPFGFYGVDLSSSLEKSKGKKDRMKIENFMKAVKRG